MKKLLVLLSFLFSIYYAHAQKEDYSETFKWVIETISNNDAGFQYIIDKKGENDYKRFTLDIESKIADLKNDDEFIDLVYQWLHYFRKGHVEFGLKENPRKKISHSNFEDNELHLDKLSDKTLYLRIPSFEFKNKSAIDSIINVNYNLITATQNLIIDIRNGTGGSDASFKKLIPLLYTNPIRSIGILFKGSELNAKGFESYAEMTKDKKLHNIAKLLRENNGKFVPVDTSSKTSVIKLDSILHYPQRIAILINGKNVSSDEQFLLFAKQSWKVKLFGRSTSGAIDISNLNVTFSSDNKYYLVYAMSKSKRIPDFTIDDLGLQPDFFIDDEIPETEWISFTKDMLEK